MNKQEVINLIKGTEYATFILPGVGETTIPTIELKPMVEAWEQQLTNGWIPVSEPPTSDGRFEVTLKGSKGKRHVEMCNYHKDAKGNPWGSKWDSVNVIAWRQRPEPYKEVSE